MYFWCGEHAAASVGEKWLVQLRRSSYTSWYLKKSIFLPLLAKNSEPEFLRSPEIDAKESIPQPMKPGGPVR
jgi:hypothetical protein